jgi:hypothetical protein
MDIVVYIRNAEICEDGVAGRDEGGGEVHEHDK